MINEEMKQNLSSFLDGEIDSNTDKTVERLANDKSLHRLWHRYQLISDVLNRELPGVVDRKLADRVAQDITSEPAILAPGRMAPNSLFRTVAGFAIAASVATVAVIGVQYNSIKNSPDQQNTAVEIVDNSPDINTNISQYTFPASTSVVRTQIDEIENTEEPNARLNSYLVNHSEFRTSQSGVQTMNPYVRIIANENTE